ncbi:LysR family transcriptional regulator [Conexibacter sp. W3-3-2]|uniref:LysR family transcriptional regulator n=1 Tax=Conexibacter sp. W3-3-2 TaxID=2675227 RepID=UPI0012B7EAEC|nr:LysR substrate-binding domain-containing protein [Conexibacter sp. W3-3-2]MTD46107.1 LysR family transcriptional regulator [Conexibacter sp. W3-3-2]
MTLLQLRYLLATVEHGSFSAAADALHLAQPTLSEQLRKLERELGVELFRRVGRGIVPTEAGLTLRDHATAVLEAVDGAVDAVAAVRELRGGVATFGTWGTARYYPGAEIVAAFRARHPGVRVRIVGQNSAEVVAMIRSGELEAGMVALPVDDRDLEIRPIIDDEVVYVSAHPEHVRTSPTIETVAATPLVLSESTFGTEDPTRRQLVERAQRAGVDVDPEIDVEDIEAALDLAALGHGATIVARGMLRGLGDRVPANLGWTPFAEPLVDTFAFVHRRGAHLSPASRAFLELAEAHLLDLARALRVSPPSRRPARGPVTRLA